MARDIHHEEMSRQVRDLFVQLENAPDALAVIRAAAYVEGALRLALSERSVAESDDILSRGPLRSLSAVVKRAHALGILSNDDRDDLDRIRGIRNDCAHTFEDVDLAHPPFCGLTEQLRAWRFWTDERDATTKGTNPAESKTRLLLTAAVLAEDLLSPLGATRTLRGEELRRFLEGVFRTQADD